MINAVYATLGKTPEALDSIRVNQTTSIDLCGVLNPLVGVANLAHKVVTAKLICINGIAFITRHLLHNQGNQAPSLDIGHDFSHDIAASLDYPHDRGFGLKASALLSAASTEVRLVNLNIAVHRLLSLSHDSPDCVEHSPSRLVGNSQLPLKLLGRDTTASRSHQEHSIEPGTERRGTVVKDGIGCGADLVAAELTAKDSPSGNKIVLRNLATLRAQDTIVIASLDQKPKASRIIGKLGIKLLQGIGGLFHGLFSLSRFIIPQKVRDVKG